MIDNFIWQAGRLRLTFATPSDGPVSLILVQVDGQSIPFTPATTLSYPTLRQPLDDQPLVEVLLAAEGHARSGQRRVASAVGGRLRYQSHTHERTGPVSTFMITQIDPKTGLRATLRLVARADAAAFRADLELVNDGPRPLDLTGASSIVVAPDGTGETMRPEEVRLCWARSDWLAENRWTDEPVRERLLPDLGLTVHGQDPRGALTVSAVGSWSTGDFLPTAVLHDTRTGLAIGWQVESSGGWTWEVGERRQGLYVLAQGPDEAAQQWRHRLAPEDSFRTVPVAVAFSDRGRDGVFGELTRHRRTTRRPHPDAGDLPVIFNDYMNTLDGNPSSAVLISLIRSAAVVGAEVFVVDAGWYSDEEYWWDTVGEWQVSARRFAHGFEEVVEAIRDGGMRPGLWLEPEVVGVRSPAVATLPDDAFLQRGGIRVVEHQRFHLDLRHPAARAHLDRTIDRLVADFGIEYFKFDYNISAQAGTDLNADSPGDGRHQVARAHLDWLTGVLDRHPGLTIENCSSGAMRADHAVLCIAQLQSTSDQQNADRYPPIAASAPASMTPEQAANWAYPQPEMSTDEIVFTLVNGMLGRLYLSGFLDRMTPTQLALVRDAVQAHRQIRTEIAAALPVWPLGLPGWNDPHIALGLVVPDGTVLLSVWDRRASGDALQIPWPGYRNRPLKVESIFPSSDDVWQWGWNPETADLTVLTTPHTPTARTVRLRFARDQIHDLDFLEPRFERPLNDAKPGAGREWRRTHANDHI